MSMGLEIGGISLSFLGWLGSILCCWLPMWRVTAFLSYNTLFVQIIWEGLWRSCMLQSTGQMRCKVYDSMLALGADIQAARALIVIAIVLGASGVNLSLFGAQCTHCIEEESVKAKVTIVSGVLFLLAGVVTLIPVCWLTNGIIREFYDVSGAHRELGVALYIGWAASALFLFGGALLCCSCPRKEDKYRYTNVTYTAAPRSIVTV